MNINIDTDVYSSDGNRVGRVDLVVLDPATNDVTSIVIRRGRLLMHDVVAPLNMVARTTDEAVYLRVDSTVVNDLPEFREEAFRAPRAEEQPLGAYAPESILYPIAGYFPPVAPRPGASPAPTAARRPVGLREGIPVFALDGPIGTVDKVLTDAESDEITGLVVKQGTLLTRDTTIPVAWVSSITPDRVHIAATRQQIEDQLFTPSGLYVPVEGDERPSAEG